MTSQMLGALCRSLGGTGLNLPRVLGMITSGIYWKFSSIQTLQSVAIANIS
jgi:hypothetical protein